MSEQEAVDYDAEPTKETSNNEDKNNAKVILNSLQTELVLPEGQGILSI